MGPSMDHMIRKALPLQVFIVGMCLTGFGVINTVRDYLSYPVMSRISVLEEVNVKFPAVTLCNLNRVSCENLRMAMESRQDRNYTRELCTILILGKCARAGPWAPSTASRCSRALNVDAAAAATDDDEAATAAEMTFRESFNRLPASLRVEIGHRMNDTVVKCRMNGKPCDLERHFRSFSSFKYGNCFSFNDYLVGSGIEVSRAGPAFGLQLELFLDAASYLGGGLTPASGFRVGLSQQDTPMDLENAGINIQSGQLTSVGTKMRELTRLPHPYPSECLYSWDVLASCTNATSQTVAALGNIRYTNMYCQRLCLLIKTRTNCGCYNADLDVNPAGLLDKPGSRICSKRNASEVECAAAMVQELGPCLECRSACQEVVYEQLISTAKWPADSFVDHYTGRLDATDRGRDKEEEEEALVRREFSRLEIYLEGKEVTLISEYALITSKDLLVGLGGALSLWLGMSFVTIIEVAEVTTELIFGRWTKCLADKTAN